jgi:cobalamin biosynthesis protein CbiM
MHIPDGFIDVPTSAAFGAISVAGVAFSLKGARKQLDERAAPLAGLVAVFIFAVQMLNFPVGAGTSGHLMGGALAMVLVGPHAAVLAVTVVLMVQALMFADGGLVALGLNVFNLSLVGVWVPYLVYLLAKSVMPKVRSSVVVAAFLAALVSVPVAAVAFVAQYWLGGSDAFSIGAVFAAMLGTHVFIGIGEAVITAFTVSAVLASRQDLVFGWKPNRLGGMKV